jgi:hypothetical protein
MKRRSFKVKRIRILILNNPITALFMDAWLNEIESKDADTTTIIFYEERVLPSGYCENPEERNEEHKKYTIILFHKKYSIFFPPAICKDYNTFLSLLKNHKKIKKDQVQKFKQLKSFLDASNLTDANVTEIWYGNDSWHIYLKLLFPSAATIKFDHGLTETLMYFLDNQKSLYHRIYVRLGFRGIRRDIEKLYFVVPSSEEPPDNHLTLNAKQINSVLGFDKTKMISPDRVNSRASFPIKYHFDLDAESSLAIVLLENIKPWARSDSDHEEYFNDFETMLISCGGDKFKENGIKTIIFKPKHMHEEYARDAVNNFRRLGEMFELKYFPDLYENLPLEYFLSSLCPKVIIGNLSSGLYYARHLLPRAQTYTYDVWFVDYTMKKFGVTYPDFQIMRPILYGSHAKYFESLNPIDLWQISELPLVSR